MASKMADNIISPLNFGAICHKIFKIIALRKKFLNAYRGELIALW